MLLVPVSAVHAQDVLTGTSPEDGQTVEDMPQVVGLTFSNTPIALGSDVLVQNVGGQNWAAGDLEIVDNVVTQPISPEAPAGK
jgi:copper resistance protein C